MKAHKAVVIATTHQIMHTSKKQNLHCGEMCTKAAAMWENRNAEKAALKVFEAVMNLQSISHRLYAMNGDTLMSPTSILKPQR